MDDAVCRLNPVYGQGMSSAAMQAEILDELLQQRKIEQLWKPYFKQVAKAVKTPWDRYQLATTFVQKPAHP